MVGAVYHGTPSGSLLRRLTVTDLAPIALRSSEEGVGSINFIVCADHAVYAEWRLVSRHSSDQQSFPNAIREQGIILYFAALAWGALTLRTSGVTLTKQK